MITKAIDKMLNLVGLTRVKNKAQSGSLSAASLWEWVMSPFSGHQSIDSEMRYRLPVLRREARKLAFNNPIIGQYLDLLKNNVIGHQGIKLQAQVKDNSGKLNKKINDKIEAAWADFWSNPWVDGRLSGVHGEQLLIKSMAVDGEIFVRRVISGRYKYGIALQIIDPDQIDSNLNQPRSGGNNEIRLGVEVDEYSCPVAYHCYTTNPNDLNGSQREVIRIPADEIIHLFDPERIGQTRGYTWFNRVMQNLRNLDGYVEAAIVAARTAACAVPIFKQTAEFGVDERAKDYKVDINPGTGITLPAGLELQDWNPNHPNTNHGEFLKGNLRFLAAGLNVSYSALSCDLSEANYSSMRSGLLIERDGWRSLQQLWIDQFRQPVFGWFLWGGILNGTIVLDSRDPRKFTAVRWIPRGWLWVDPLKDVTAAVLAIENLMGSRTRYLGEQGEDYEAVCEDLTREKELATAAGLTILTDNPQPGQDANQTDDQPASTKKQAARRLAIVNMLAADDSEINRDQLQRLLQEPSND